MPHSDATGELSQLSERFAHKEGFIFSARDTDLLDDPGKIGVAKPIGLVANAGRPLTEGIESPRLLGVLEMVHLLGETDASTARTLARNALERAEAALHHILPPQRLDVGVARVEALRQLRGRAGQAAPQ